MPRTPSMLITAFATCEIVEAVHDDPQDFSGDEFPDEIEQHMCPVDPFGHLFHTACGVTRCLRCGFISWK